MLYENDDFIILGLVANLVHCHSDNMTGCFQWLAIVLQDQKAAEKSDITNLHVQVVIGISLEFTFFVLFIFAFSALTVLVGQQEGHL